MHKADPATACALCGLTAHRPIVSEIGEHSVTFCCGGCRQVYQVLVESGQASGANDLTQTPLFQQCLQMGLVSRPDTAEETKSDDTVPTATIAHEGDSVDTVRETALQVGGMWCSSCAWVIEHALGHIRGVEHCRVSFASDMVRVSYRPARTSTEDIARAIQGLGYTAEPYSESGSGQSPQDNARRSAFIRGIVALIFAINAGMFSMAIYVGFFQQLDPIARIMLPRWAFVLSLPVFWAGWPIFQKAWGAAKHGKATMETLITLGAWTAFLYSFWVLVHNGTDIYFDTADMLIAFVLIGKHVEAGAKGQATAAITLLHALLPRKALVRTTDGRELLVALDKLGPGDLVVVRPGDRIPADGVVEEGEALVDESLLTGESRPITKSAGDEVTGATIATDAPLTVRVSRTGEGSTISRMIAMVEEALSAKSATERWADQISRRFVPAILAIALITACVLIAGHAAASVVVVRIVAILVVACPCALSLATPLAITTAVGVGARRGILISNAGVLEILPRVRRVLLDKTGTLTEGHFAVRNIIVTERAEDRDLLAVAALESFSEHPIARAIVGYVEKTRQATADLSISGLNGHNNGQSDSHDDALERSVASDFQRHDVQGVTGLVAGERWFVGNRTLAENFDAAVPADIEAQAATVERTGQTVVFYGRKGSLRGMIVLGDAIRPGAAECVSRLRASGMQVGLISGDAVRTTEAVAQTVGISDVGAQMRPADKIERVRTTQGALTAPNRPAVAMVGDGINDAPALAQADVGIAFGSGTEIARRAADITLVSDDLSRLADLFTLANRTASIIRQNLFWACLYNLVCIPLAVAGLVGPLVAASAMLISSLCVLANSKRLRGVLNK